MTEDQKAQVMGYVDELVEWIPDNAEIDLDSLKDEIIEYMNDHSIQLGGSINVVIPRLRAVVCITPGELQVVGIATGKMKQPPFQSRLCSRQTIVGSFGSALEELKNGNRVARTGWNGKGMYLTYFSPVAHGMEMLNIWDCENGTEKPLLPFIMMKTADDMYVPWLASQSDMLASDWLVVG